MTQKGHLGSIAINNPVKIDNHELLIMNLLDWLYVHLHSISAISKAKEANMPSDNIDRAIKKGTGELPGVTYEEVQYEAYGPGGIAVLIEALTDNKNRTTSEVRNVLEKKGGNMSGAGSVAWQFQMKGYLIVKKVSAAEDKLMSIVLDAGA